MHRSSSKKRKIRKGKTDTAVQTCQMLTSLHFSCPRLSPYPHLPPTKPHHHLPLEENNPAVAVNAPVREEKRFKNGGGSV